MSPEKSPNTEEQDFEPNENWGEEDAVPNDGTQHLPEDSLIFFAEREAGELPEIESFIHASMSRKDIEDTFDSLFGEYNESELEELYQRLSSSTQNLLELYIKRKGIPLKDALKRVYTKLIPGHYLTPLGLKYFKDSLR